MVKYVAYKNVTDFLEASNICRRCMLRFYGIKEYTSYLQQNVEKIFQNCLTEKQISLSEAEVKELSKDEEPPHNPHKDSQPPHKRVMITPCAACLGVLQDIDKMVLKVEEAVNKSQHKFQDFVLQISLPAVIDLRGKLFFLHLQAKLGEDYTLGEDDIPSVKDICKWVLGSQFGEITKTDFTPFSNFQILLSSSYVGTVKECSALFKECPAAFPNARKRIKEEAIYSRAAILKAIDAVSSNIKNLYTLPPSPPDKSCTFDEVQCKHSPLYLGGRYNKYSRELSQTPWILDGERRMDSSVSELIVDVVHKHILADKIVFSASGREDVDVKMLGDGRPFVLEILNPRNVKWSTDELRAVEREINQNTDLIAVKDLQVISKEDTSILKEGEAEKRKTYSALCIVKKILEQKDVEILENLRDVTLHQKTPLRVLHRRTLSTREKLLHSLKAKIVDEHHISLLLETQAGTYIKEFVHSDFGRTTPSLGTLLDTTADILELDVESIHLDWPPKSTSS